MAYISNRDEEDQLNQAGVQGVQNPMLSPSSGAITPNQSPQNAPPASGSSQKPTGSGFVNLFNYLDQNKTQSQGLSNKVGSTITGAGDEAKNKINQTQDVFNQKNQAGTTQFNKGVLDTVFKDPVKATEQQATDAKKQLNNTYQGPNQLSDVEDENGLYTGILSSIGLAKNKVENSKTEGGRKELLREVEKSPIRTAGISSLNNLLLQNDPNSKQTLANARTGVGDLDERFNNAKATTEALAAKSVADAAAAKQQAQGLFDKNNQSYINRLNSKALSENERNKNLINALNERYNNGNLTIDDLKSLGLVDKNATIEGILEAIKKQQERANGAAWSQEDVMNPAFNPFSMVNLDALTNRLPEDKNINSFISKTPELGVADRYTKEDLAKIKALQSLGSSEYLNNLQMPVTPSSPDAKSQPYTVNQAAFDDIINGKVSYDNTLLDKLSPEYDSLVNIIKQLRFNRDKNRGGLSDDVQNKNVNGTRGL